jgi:hypothetical protein
MSLVSLLSDEAVTDSGEVITRTLSPMTPDTQLDLLVHFFSAAERAEEVIVKAVASAWLYLVTHSIWQTRFPTLESFQLFINFVESVEPFLSRNDILATRFFSNCNTIISRWGMDPRTDWPLGMNPQPMSGVLARKLASLSLMATYEHVLPLLQFQIKERQSTPYALKSTSVCTRDVTAVIQVIQNRISLQRTNASSAVYPYSRVAQSVFTQFFATKSSTFVSGRECIVGPGRISFVKLIYIVNSRTVASFFPTRISLLFGQPRVRRICLSISFT